MLMGNGEFFSSREYNNTSEYMHFPAETYVKLREENPAGKEEARLGNEATTFQEKPKPKNGGTPKSIIDNIFNSIKGVATTATVAVAATVVTTTLVMAAPSVEMISLECGTDYVEYEMEIRDLSEDEDYAIVISTSNEEDVEIEVDGDGTYNGRVEGLKPSWEYTISLVCRGTALGDVVHFSERFQTLKHVEQLPDPPPEPPTPEPPTPDYVPPRVTVTGAEIIGTNKIKIGFTHENVTDDTALRLDILFADMTESTVTLTADDLLRGYVETEMATSDTLTVTPIATATWYGEEMVTECDSFTHTFESTLTVDATVSFYDGSVILYPVGIMNGAEYLSVRSTENPDEELQMLGSTIVLWYDTVGEITYTVYLTNENGDVLSNEATVTVKTDLEIEKPEYSFTYLNPGDINVTYNSDGTINVYLDTMFECDDPSVYYQITLGNYRYVSRDPIARIEGLSDGTYPIYYDICVEVDGALYSVFRTNPSGSINEQYYYVEGWADGNTFNLTLFDEYMYVDPSYVRVVSSAGEELILGHSDLVYNSEGFYYECAVEFTEEYEYVTVYAYVNSNLKTIDGIDGYIGDLAKLNEITIEVYP